jgi:glycopeptide antibiotics resistance protein
MKKRFNAIVFVIYSVFLISLLVFKNMPTINMGGVMLRLGGRGRSESLNLVPFSSILPYIRGQRGGLIALINLGGNIALFIPIGIMATYVWKMNWKRALMLGITSSLIIEGLQSILRVGVVDIDDVILNALGVMIGYLSAYLFSKYNRDQAE